MHTYKIVALASLALTACGGRPLAVVADGGLTPPALDTGARPVDSTVRPDACVLPEGLCLPGTQECRAGFQCELGYACAGKATYQCGCTELYLCKACSSVVGKCVRVCATNADCPSDYFCEHDGQCVITGAHAGQCTPRPKSCPAFDTDHDTRVCGCDGKSYENGVCEAHQAGVSVATAGPCLATTCAGLEAAYQAELKKSRACCAKCPTGVAQCIQKAPSSLICPCDTYTDLGVTPAMKALKAEWLARSCWTMINVQCDACGLGLQGGGCGDAGSCVDYFMD